MCKKTIFTFISSMLAGFLVFFIGKSDFAVSDAEKGQVVLNIYSERNTELLDPVLKAYRKKAPYISFRVHTDKAPHLIEKLKQKSSHADLFITVDVGYLVLAEKLGLLSKQNFNLSSRESYLRDNKGHWFGVSLRARTIFYNPEKVSSQELADLSYEKLADSQFKKRLCLRTSKKVYNQSLVSFFIVAWGEEKAKKVLKGWVNNLAAPVFTSDTRLLEAVASGQCDLAVANSYYYGRLIRKNSQVTQKLKIFWPQDKLAAHVNISGAAVLKQARNKKQAALFLKWLLSQEAQKIFSNSNLEYPLSYKISDHKIVRSFSQGMKVNKNHTLKQIGETQTKALKLIHDVQYN